MLKVCKQQEVQSEPEAHVAYSCVVFVPGLVDVVDAEDLPLV